MCKLRFQRPSAGYISALYRQNQAALHLSSDPFRHRYNTVLNRNPEIPHTAAGPCWYRMYILSSVLRCLSSALPCRISLSPLSCCKQLCLSASLMSLRPCRPCLHSLLHRYRFPYSVRMSCICILFRFVLSINSRTVPGTPHMILYDCCCIDIYTHTRLNFQPVQDRPSNYYIHKFHNNWAWSFYLPFRQRCIHSLLRFHRSPVLRLYCQNTLLRVGLNTRILL